jgi:hypothetical protein
VAWVGQDDFLVGLCLLRGFIRLIFSGAPGEQWCLLGGFSGAPCEQWCFLGV